MESPRSPGVRRSSGLGRYGETGLEWQMGVNERKKIGRIRAVSCTRPRVLESEEEREIRKSVIMAKDARSPLRASGNEWLYCQS